MKRPKKNDSAATPAAPASTAPTADTRPDTSDRPNSSDNLKYRGASLEQVPMTKKAHAFRIEKGLQRDSRFHQECARLAKAKTVTVTATCDSDASGKVIKTVTPEVWVSRDEYETLRTSGSVTVTGVQLTLSEVTTLAASILAAREERQGLSDKQPDESAAKLGLTDTDGQMACSVNAVDCRGKFRPTVQFALVRNRENGKLEVKRDRNNQPVRIGSFRAVNGEIKAICPHCYRRLTEEAEKERAKGVHVDLRTFAADEVHSFIQRQSERQARDSQAVKTGLGMFVSDQWGKPFQQANHGGRRDRR